MSAHRLVLLYCDDEECPRGLSEGGDVPFDANGLEGNVRKQRASAKENGWIRRGGKDYCDLCAAKFGRVDGTYKRTDGGSK